MNNVVLKGKLGAGFNDDRYTLPKDGNPGDILVKTETGSAWEKQEPATSTPDWYQNDPTARDYVKNRPGGVPATFETIFDGDITSTLDGSTYWGSIQPAKFVLEEECEYEVTLDTKTYIGVCEHIGDTDVSFYYVSDKVKENGVVYMVNNNDSTTTNIFVTKTAISHVTVRKIVSPIQKFPQEYIPDVFCRKTIFYTNTIAQSKPYTLYTDRNLTEPATNEELAESYTKGLVYIYDIGYASMKSITIAISCEITEDAVGYNNGKFGTLLPES